MARHRSAIVLAVLAVLAVGGGCGEKKSADPPEAAPAPTSSPAGTSSAGQRRDGKEPKPDPVAPESAELTLVVDGAPKGPVGMAQLAEVKPLLVEGDSGEEARNAWSVRDVVAKLVAPNARLVTVKGLNGQLLAVDATHWKDPARIPVMRINRRGLVKFFWTTPTGEPLPQGDIRGVTELDVATK